MLISVVACNVYPSQKPIDFLLRHLALQTYRDFELILVDAFYNENRELVTELRNAGQFQNLIHVPACEAKHVGRRLHWELYNNGAVLASGRWVFYYGVYRYLHRRGMEAIADRASRGVSIIFDQKRCDAPADLAINYEQDFHMNVDGPHWGTTLDQSGFFVAERDLIVNTLNGYNEAVVNDHWVDCDLGARAKHVSLSVDAMRDCLLRLDRQGHYGLDGHTQTSGIGKPFCREDVNPKCVVYLIGNLRERRHIDEPVQRFIHSSFEWVRCPECGTLGIEDSNAWISHLVVNEGLKRAPINVYGVGRNLKTLSDDLHGLDLDKKIEILSTSHDNPKYLS